MCLLHIHARSYGKVFEVLPTKVEHTELVVEGAVSLVLLKLFGAAEVDEVTIHFSSVSQTGQRDCSIDIQAQCSYQSFTLLPCTKEYMELAIGKSVGAILQELFGSVAIESVVIQHTLSKVR